MPSRKNKKQGRNSGKGGRHHRTTTTATTATSSAEAIRPLSPDLELALGYFDLADYAAKQEEYGLAMAIMQEACKFHDSLPLLHYWYASAAFEAAYDLHNRCGSQEMDMVLSYLRRAGEAAHRATTLSPCDIEFLRLYSDSLAGQAILEKSNFHEAILVSCQALGMQNDTMVFEDRLCSTHTKEEIIEAIMEQCQWMEDIQGCIAEMVLLKPVKYYRRVNKKRSKQIDTENLMTEMKQKKWRQSCWDSMSDDKKVELLTVKYDDLRTFFHDKEAECATDALMKAFGVVVGGESLRYWYCYTCKNKFNDYESHMLHVRTKHIGSLPENLQQILPEEDISRTSVPDFGARKFLLSFDSAKLVLHMCNGTVREVSFETDFLKSSLPDPITFISWLNSDVEKGLDDDILRQEDILFLLLKNKFKQKLEMLKTYENLTFNKKALEVADLCLAELKMVENQKASVLEVAKKKQNEELASAKDNPEKARAVPSLLQVISDLIPSEPDLGKDTGDVLSLEQLEAHMKSVFKEKQQTFADKCDSSESSIRETITHIDQLEIMLSRTCLVDLCEKLLPHLALFLKARLTDFVYAHATEETDKLAEVLFMSAEGASSKATGGSNPSKQLVKNPKGKTKKKERVFQADNYFDETHQQEADSELMSSTKVGCLPGESSQPEVQTDSPLELEKMLEKVLEPKRKLSEEMKQNVTQQQKEEPIAPFGRVDQENPSAITDNDLENQEVGSSYVHGEQPHVDLIPLKGCSASYAAQILNQNNSTAANEIIPHDSDNDDVFLTMLNDSINQRSLANVIILPLCELKPFHHELGMKLSLHKDVGKPCVVCELGDIVIAFGKGSSRERAVNSILGKFSFSNLVNDSYHLQQAHYNAPDILLAIFDCLHESFTSSSDPAAELNKSASMNLLMCETGICLMHDLFGMNINEVTEYPCGLKARREKPTYFHSVTAKKLCSMKVTSTPSSFEEILQKVALHNQFVCQPTCHCRKYSNLSQKLLNRPQIFIAVVNWEIDNSADDISATLEIISDEIDLSALYDGVDRESKYLLQSMICCSLKYVCFVRDFERNRWFLYDGLEIEDVSGWDAVVSRCEDESFRPEVLMYVREG